MSNDDIIVIKGTQEGNAATVLLRGANDFLLDEMDRSLHDSFCIVKRVMESGSVVPGASHSGFDIGQGLTKLVVTLNPPIVFSDSCHVGKIQPLFLHHNLGGLFLRNMLRNNSLM